MPKRSAGLLLCRAGPDGPEVLLSHPGGPFWARRDAGAWTIPKGEYVEGENPAAAARREFREELGHEAPEGGLLDLGEIRQKAGKVVRAYAVCAEFDPASIEPGTIEIEWPPRTGRMITVPEIDRVAWFSLADAAERILEAQKPFLERAARVFAKPGLSPAP